MMVLAIAVSWAWSSIWGRSWETFGKRCARSRRRAATADRLVRHEWPPAAQLGRGLR
jgi:hypothetical protein